MTNAKKFTPEWVSVDDELPEEDGDYYCKLLYGKEWYARVVMFKDGNWIDEEFDENVVMFFDCLLPAPPEKAKETI